MSAPDDQPLDPSAKPFLAHLEDLRSTMIWIAAFVFGGILIVIPFVPWITAALQAPLEVVGLTDLVDLQLRGPDESFALAMQLVCWSGILVSAPFVLVTIARFVFPGLTRREKRAVLSGCGFSAVLFAMGVLIGYRLTVPVALQFSVKVSGWMGFAADEWRAAQYIGFVLKLLLAFGITFQLPVVLLAFGYVGILKSRVLREKRPHAVVGLLVISMFLTPSDPITMLLMGIPLISLYELCIWLIWARERRRDSGTRH